MTRAPKYLVQVRQRGEPWLTHNRHDDEGLACDDACKQANRAVLRDHGSLGCAVVPLFAYVRVIYRGREVFNPRAPRPIEATS